VWDQRGGAQDGGAQDKQGAACRTSGAVHMASRGDAQVRQQGTGAALALPRAVPAAMHRCRQRLDEATERTTMIVVVLKKVH
jgi:hypothetical protein